MEDLDEVDSFRHSMLKQIQEGSVSYDDENFKAIFDDYTFEADFGDGVLVELCEDGASKQLTRENAN